MRTQPSDGEGAQRKVRWDPTVNLGHILTFAGFIVTILVSWSTLDKRVALLEAARVDQQQRDAGQDQSTKETIQAINAHLGKIDDKLDRLVDRRP